MDLKSSVRRWGTPRGVWRVAGLRLGYAGGPEDQQGNFGDQLSPLVLRHVFGATLKQSGLSQVDLVSLGSILEWLEQSTNRLRPHVWGSGFIEDGGSWAGPPVRLHAVRGELSRERMRAAAGRRSIALGDPGMLVDAVFPDLVGVTKRFPLSVVPHYVDFEDPMVSELRRRLPQVHVIDVLRHPRDVTADIAASEVVLSSSLHGLIVAEAMGVPNHWTPMSDKVIGGAYKFADYYSAFGVEAKPLALVDAADQVLAGRLRSAPLRRWNQRRAELLAAYPGPRRSL
ncbi:polysaccharide pyruvyl transferase family protein [Calidifontibacter terrae]